MVLIIIFQVVVNTWVGGGGDIEAFLTFSSRKGCNYWHNTWIVSDMMIMGLSTSQGTTYLGLTGNGSYDAHRYGYNEMKNSRCDFYIKNSYYFEYKYYKRKK